ncbi:Hypothetical protein GbCGDNIH2_7190 [Granulibacter bethesdensis]|nr:Hypothetical protein GbCGDNIH2_7190 [Granulibacter bethesdensis]
MPVHPRAGGEHTRDARFYHGRTGSSPRRRGTRYRALALSVLDRFIPAQAGNTALPFLS